MNFFIIHIFLSSFVFFSDAFLTNKLPIIKKANINNNLKMFNPLPGSDIGIPLNIFQNVYTKLNLCHFLQFLIEYTSIIQSKFL